MCFYTKKLVSLAVLVFDARSSLSIQRDCPLNKMMKRMMFVDQMITLPGNFMPDIRLGQIFRCQTQTFGLTVVPHQVALVFKKIFHSANISGQEKSATAQGQPETVGPIAFDLVGNIGT